MKIKFTTQKQAEKLLDGNVECNITNQGTACRKQDDSDGSMAAEHYISVFQGLDGDMYIWQGTQRWLRFRTVIGGTMSPRVHNALRLLAIAIEMDNKDTPHP